METKTHVFFYGHTPNAIGVHVFSQFFPCHFTDDETGTSYKLAEQWMMSHKALLFGDSKTNDSIMAASDPVTVKSLGRKVKNFDEDEWNKIKYETVVKGNFLKFSQNPDLLERLRQTGSKTIVGASKNDSIWGIGLEAKDAIKMNPADWPGQNLLGKALMEVRERLRK
jgi:ribA/ribD-fused uncharacterized protein